MTNFKNRTIDMRDKMENKERRYNKNERNNVCNDVLIRKRRILFTENM